MSTHRGARADGFAVCVAEYDTAGLLGKFVFGMKYFPGCGAGSFLTVVF